MGEVLVGQFADGLGAKEMDKAREVLVCHRPLGHEFRKDIACDRPELNDLPRSVDVQLTSVSELVECVLQFFLHARFSSGKQDIQQLRRVSYSAKFPNAINPSATPLPA